MKPPRRREIALRDRRTVHAHYGTGSRYVLKENFVGLPVELQRLCHGARLTDTRPNISTGPREAIHNPGDNRINGSNYDNGDGLSRLLGCEDRWNSRHHVCAHDNAEK
jgi:hypothetical protein